MDGVVCGLVLRKVLESVEISMRLEWDRNRQVELYVESWQKTIGLR